MLEEEENENKEPTVKSAGSRIGEEEELSLREKATLFQKDYKKQQMEKDKTTVSGQEKKWLCFLSFN